MKEALSVVLACPIALSLVTCGGGSKPTETSTTTAAGDTTTEAAADITAADVAAVPGTGAEVANKDKPLIWFNRQPSSSATGQLDMMALNFNRDTYYVDSDANQDTELQGTMIKDYVEKNIDSIDRNGDGVTGYVLAIGDIGHNDSITRIRGIRKALGTAVEKDGNVNSDPADTNADGTATTVQDGSIEVGRKTYVIRELVSQEMKSSAGVTWDTVTAGNTADTRSSSFSDQIDIVASSNDGTDVSVLNAWSKDNKIPTSGYDVNSDAVAAIAEGYGGTISQYADIQAYLTFRVLRDALDGVDIDTGIDTADDAGNVLSPDVHVYKADKRSYYALSVAVTAENYIDFTDSTMVYTPVSNQLSETTHATESAWPNTYNSADNLLGSIYQPLLQKYDKLLSLKVDYIGDDGQAESNITNRPRNPSQYGTPAINTVKTDNAAPYASPLEQ